MVVLLIVIENVIGELGWGFMVEGGDENSLG